MRKILPNEECISAAEIVARFASATGFALHATNAGNAAKALGLDFVEVDVERPVEAKWSKKERRYSVIDMPLIFKSLNELAASRARYEN
ncbi:hypothetical protein [Massilia sp. CCM 8734]|uniref:hypothetical protein n=1 Tax=Massilia sp. CCM 8734 TaxID=2609283 RepID=UPI001420779B|nr:hypothetical protein [Massilia sp. CCM 8734]NHZ99113.1 hypothetical protein [Massilia sp. CCM 8734]